MIRKYHNHKSHTTPWHREEEPLNRHETPRRQVKQSNQLSLPNQDDCKPKFAKRGAQLVPNRISTICLNNSKPNLMTIMSQKIVESITYFLT